MRQVLNPKVSVIIPLYNKAPYIKRAIDSVLSQTIQDFEILVVNDGSTDEGEIIVQQCNDSRIRVINQENQGVSVARNNGVIASNSELIAFLDADDEWLPDFLETVLRLRNKWPNAGLYGTGWYKHYPNDVIKKCHNNSVSKGDSLVLSPFKCVVKDGDFPISASTVLIPKSVIQEVGLFKVGIPYGEDLEYWSRVALYYPFACNSEAHAIYHKNITGSATHEHALTLKYWKGEYHPLQETLSSMPEEWINQYKYKSDLKLYTELWNFEWALERMEMGERKKALNLVLSAKSREFRVKKMCYISYLALPTCIQKIIKHIKLN